MTPRVVRRRAGMTGSDGYFAGLLSNSPGNYELCHISKEDFYRSNYDGAFQ